MLLLRLTLQCSVQDKAILPSSVNAEQPVGRQRSHESCHSEISLNNSSSTEASPKITVSGVHTRTHTQETVKKWSINGVVLRPLPCQSGQAYVPYPPLSLSHTSSLQMESLPMSYMNMT
jgi:hypothetical protein